MSSHLKLITMRSYDQSLVWAVGVSVGALVALTSASVLHSYSRRKRLLVTKQKLRKDSGKVSLFDESTSEDAICLLELQRLVDVIERDIVPLTCISACDGAGANKMDGAAILNSGDLSLILATTNQESRCFLYHAATLAIEEYCEMLFLLKILDPTVYKCTALLTHKPCRRCQAALWTGMYDSVYYLFDNESFPEGANMGCSISNNVLMDDYSDTSAVGLFSICRIVDQIGERRKLVRTGASDISESGGSSPVLTARSMAEAAAVDSLLVKIKRRINQLKMIYTRINTERLSTAKS